MESKIRIALNGIIFGFAIIVVWVFISKYYMDRYERPDYTFGNSGRDALVVLHFIGAKDPNIPILISIEDIERFIGIEVTMPTVRELQEWCVTHDVNVPIDGFWGDKTKVGIDTVRCRQEARKHYRFFSLERTQE